MDMCLFWKRCGETMARRVRWKSGLCNLCASCCIRLTGPQKTDTQKRQLLHVTAALSQFSSGPRPINATMGRAHPAGSRGAAAALCCFHSLSGRLYSRTAADRNSQGAAVGLSGVTAPAALWPPASGVMYVGLLGC